MAPCSTVRSLRVFGVGFMEVPDKMRVQRMLSVKNLVKVPIIADMVNPKPISVAENPILLKTSDVK